MSERVFDGAQKQCSTKFIWSNVNFATNHQIPTNTKAEFHSNNIIAKHSVQRAHMCARFTFGFHSFDMSWDFLAIFIQTFAQNFEQLTPEHTLKIQHKFVAHEKRRKWSSLYVLRIVVVFAIYITNCMRIVQWQMPSKVFEATEKKVELYCLMTLFRFSPWQFHFSSSDAHSVHKQED